MSGCSFSSVWDVYDGGIAPSLNSPSSSLSASNTSFVRCIRSQNVALNGSEENPSKQARLQITENRENSFTWCVWNGSKTTGTSDSVVDAASSGGAIYICNKASGTLSVKFCLFNDCYAYCVDGGIYCDSIDSVKVENNSFNACAAQNYYGGGVHAEYISSCVMISDCAFQKCTAKEYGGGLYLYNFNVSGSACIGTENGKGESACVFDCSFTSCSLSSTGGGGLRCERVPAAFKMRSIQFISCSAYVNGGGLCLDPDQSTAPTNNIYCYFFFFHDCSCNASTPYGHDVYFVDRYNLFSSYNPFYESYTTNNNDTRVCHRYYSGSWTYLHTEKKGWLKDKTIYVGVSGDDANNLCGMSEAAPCKTVGHAVESSMAQLSSTITLLSGKHVSEGTTISVGEIKISVVGRGKTVSLIGTNSLSSSSATLFSISSGQLEVGHVGIDHNSEKDSSPNVFMVSDEVGTLSLDDVVINSSTPGGSVISASVFDVALRQLKMVDVEIKNMKMSQPLFAEPSSAGSSSGDSVLANVTVRNVNRTTGDGVVIAKNVKAREAFIVWNTTMEGCSCKEGNGGGVYVDVQESGIAIVDGTARFEGCVSAGRAMLGGRGGGMIAHLADARALFELSGNLIFERNEAEYGKNMFIFGKDLNGSVTSNSFNFNFLLTANDKTLFVGSDYNHSNKDLFMFLIRYGSFEIFISSNGFDAARCGSEEEPCQTMWKGMENMEKETGNKTILIDGSTIIQDSFNMSNYQIKKSVKMGEENVKATLNFEKTIGSQLECFMGNEIHLELTNIRLRLASGFDNSVKTIFSNKGGDLMITGCSFHSEAGVNSGFDCVFVDVIGGSVEVNDLSMESFNAGNSIFAINNAGISCELKNVRVKLLNERVGCLLLIKGPELTTRINEGGEEMNLNIDNSSFSEVKRSGNGASILESKSEKKIDLVVKESNITEDKAEESEKGGAIFFTLGSSGSMKMIDSKITNCNCSIGSGKGGGVYLATKERGDLNFTFVGMKFSSNTAKVGKDIFIECFNISSQINENLFQFDLREGHFNRDNAKYGSDSCDNPNDKDLIEYVTIHQSDTIIVSSVNGSNERQCGTSTLPCYSIDHGLMHLTSDFMSVMIVVEESVIGDEINLKEMSLSSKSREECEVEVKSNIERTREALATTAGTVSMLKVNFVFDSNFISSHESLISPEGGILEMMNCSFSSKLLVEDINECGQLTIKDFNAENISVEGNEESLISCLSMKKAIQLANCTMGGVSSNNTKGKLMKVESCLDVKMDSCIFDGSSKERNEKNLNVEEEEKCKWDGSLVDVVKSSVLMKDTTISNSPKGGITMSGGNVIIEKGEFLNNNPSIEGYPSLRRNIICSDSGTLNVMNLKGGDGLERNTSLWMLNDGCNFEGIVPERDSSFFIPVLESAEAKEETDRMKLTFKGMLFIPCNLSFSVVKRKGEEKEVEHYDFYSNGFLSETEVEGRLSKDVISSCGNEIEVIACILFGNSNAPSSTNSFILKNKSETEQKGDERIVEEGKEGKSDWLLIVIVLVKVRNEAEDLREIVNDNIRKDPKAFEMVTMEMSPEEQWRRAEREAEKKNEERIKKRVYAKSLGHSESSEHLLSESGSTEYILGRDSDKIPEWALEKVDEKEEEAQKRSPSPSISSTSTTDTSDTESTFVRGEDLCPTTSSMSNLVDAMACSSPHEKLIVDLRDSLFMLLHGRNEKKEMAIGSLQERELTAAQILFWVANLALHSFDEMEDELSSLANLSPHIVLFSEHMVICIALHSDCSSSDSDTSSISSSTVVTSTSDCSTVNRNGKDSPPPSSAFEDEDDNRKECMRWKAPEMLINKKMGATKESVVFSIGIMLWECLTLEIPFGEYEAEVAGQKIVNGERVDEKGIDESVMKNVVDSCLLSEESKRPTLTEVKKEFVKLFPAGTFIVTMTDAILVEESSEEHEEDNKQGRKKGSE
ncbi:uncharacterized protein MONOS_2972 [Monocercomonoides exilis]|uniref:uncharacterized protein n=1 Tax=Monocercomonoides exilis TaxID=2049356 RepID=UPI0035594B84|nr:hypothetical protein MONOS_2972 [Monocercomonoides exilis]|eukprot:MONOS_2972.1-p1 / transcript=MONOS_2972.1 / gene=MONOS_2972 / organism=Monocercomonoides_exilis_PA203 / gene_product=unspecified product / transcript_product=unspecified product / location=Mono_scaffold00065:126092-132188(-) / protein_length=1950 / sequence_SO=supercontig / SO=protein_coding / is_pseudo=false